MEHDVIKLINVTKKIGNKIIIDNLSLNVQKGQILGLLGPNGAGKTTIIKMIVGLSSITDGQILIHEKSVEKDFINAIANVGAIVENPEFYTYLSGYRNLVVLSNMTNDVSENRIKEVVNLVGLQKHINEKVKTYSLGMRQRLGLAQALLSCPSVLILDEPTNGLDPSGIKELREYLQDLAKNHGLTVIVSSHLLSEVELMCDRVAIIKDGRLIDLQKINKEPTVAQGNTIFFEVDTPSKAKEEIKNYLPESTIIIEDNFIKINADRELVASINSLLVSKSIKVYSIQTKFKSLEENFMEIMQNETTF